VGNESLFVSGGIGGLENLKKQIESVIAKDFGNRGNTCGAAAFPADQAIKVIARVVDFFVWPAILRDTNENNMGPMDQMNCVQ
jgi:hypothetical protein